MSAPSISLVPQNGAPAFETLKQGGSMTLPMRHTWSAGLRNGSVTV